MADRNFGFDTLCLHAGQIPDAATGARAAADLPDDVVRVRPRRSRGEPVQPADVRQRLFAALESDRRGARGADGGARRRPRGARHGDRHGRADGRAADAAAGRRSHRRGAHALRRDLLAVRRHVRAVRHRATFVDPTIRPTSAPRCAPEHEGALRRDHRQSAAQRGRHRGGGGGRARGRHPARGRQHAGLAVPVPADSSTAPTS